MTEETQPHSTSPDAQAGGLAAPEASDNLTGTGLTGEVSPEAAVGHQPRYAAIDQAPALGLAAKVTLAVVTVVGLTGAALAYMLGTMYGFTVDAGRRTDQWLSVFVSYLACGGFLAFPFYLAGLYTGARKWYLTAGAVLGGVTLLLLVLWLV
ncbi:MAG: hypothetical protein Q3997_06510 [Propionibacteriaceae bacterium]|nr:hypothetical protein [Propionibacteriaceae bacterium]